MSGAEITRSARWLPPAVVFGVVTSVQLWFVAAAGTDIPFHDQWDIEGAWLYPAWRDGSLQPTELLHPFNEHRILWTHLLNLGLFVVNGQWDPLMQLTAIAGLRGICAAGLAWLVGARMNRRARGFVAAGVIFAFLPHLPWHNVLWGIESHAYFALGLSMFAMALLGAASRTPGRTAGGLLAAGAALLAMGPGALVPVALLGLMALRAIEARRLEAATLRQAWPALLLLATAWVLRAPVTEHIRLEAASWLQFFTALGRVLAWPHSAQPLAALPMNLPLLLVVAGRLLRRREAADGEDFILLVACWSIAVALATAWVRGGSDELVFGVPSRYVDFVVLLPLANVWCVIQLAREAGPMRKRSGSWVAAAWGVFLFVGWLGLSTEVMRRLVLPRARDREAPVRLVREFQRTGDAGIFAGRPRLLVPHPNPEAVRTVLADPRMAGALPPSLQPEQPMGPLSRTVRHVLGR
jgi:hypothetical protein